jgi:hypothetical protein
LNRVDNDATQRPFSERHDQAGLFGEVDPGSIDCGSSLRVANMHKMMDARVNAIAPRHPPPPTPARTIIGRGDARQSGASGVEVATAQFPSGRSVRWSGSWRVWRRHW